MIPQFPIYGNCFVGALWLRLVCGGRLKGLRLKEGGPRHWVCRTPCGDTWHFKRQKDILPRPLCYLIFLGKFERLEPRAKREVHASQ